MIIPLVMIRFWLFIHSFAFVISFFVTFSAILWCSRDFLKCSRRDSNPCSVERPLAVSDNNLDTVRMVCCFANSTVD